MLADSLGGNIAWKIAVFSIDYGLNGLNADLHPNVPLCSEACI
jgi:hypothetical protein